jgi:hypothetical protein
MGLIVLLFVSLAHAVAPTYTPVVAYGPTNYPDTLSNMNSMRLQQNWAAGTPLPSTITDATGAVAMPVSANTPAAGAVGAYVHVVSQPASGGGTSSSFNAAFPAAGTAAGFHDGTNMQGARVFDADTGGGTQYVEGVSLRKSASGGSVEAGTSADPLRVDPTGSTVQPVSGTVTSNIGTTGGLALDATLTGGTMQTKIVDSGGTNLASVSAAGAVKVDGSAVTQPVSAASLPLPSGAATDASVTGLEVTQGSTTSGQSGPLVQGAVTTSAPAYTTAKTSPLSLTTAGGLRVDGSGSTQPVSGTVSATQGTSPWVVDGSGVTQPISAASLPLPSGAATDRTTAGGPFSVELSDGAAFYTGAKTGQLPTALVGARLDINAGSWFGSTAPTIGSKTSANSIPVVIASDQGAVAVSGTLGISGTVDVTQSTSPWVVNTTQFGSTNVSTGTGASGAGIPRVTISNDSSLAANQSVNAAQFGGTNVSTGTGTGGAGIPRVTVSSDSSLTANAGTNLNTSLLALEAGGNLALIKAKTDNLDVALSTRLKPADTLAGVTIVGSVTTLTDALPIGANTIGAVTGTSADNATNSSLKLPVLPVRANAAAPTWTEGNQAPLSTDLSGRLRMDMSSWFGSTVPTVGSKTSANSIPVVIASDQGAVAVSGTVAATQGTSPWVENVSQWLGSTAPTVGSKTSANSVPVVIASDQGAVAVNATLQTGSATIGAVTGTSADDSTNSILKLPVISARANAAEQSWGEGKQEPLSVDLTGRLRMNTSSWFGSTAPTVGSKTSANSIPVVIASDQGAVAVVGPIAIYTPSAPLPVSGPIQFQGADLQLTPTIPLVNQVTRELQTKSVTMENLQATANLYLLWMKEQQALGYLAYPY